MSSLSCTPAYDECHPFGVILSAVSDGLTMFEVWYSTPDDRARLVDLCREDGKAPGEVFSHLGELCVLTVHDRDLGQDGRAEIPACLTAPTPA